MKELDPNFAVKKRKWWNSNAGAGALGPRPFFAVPAPGHRGSVSGRPGHLESWTPRVGSFSWCKECHMCLLHRHSRSA